MINTVYRTSAIIMESLYKVAAANCNMGSKRKGHVLFELIAIFFASLYATQSVCAHLAKPLAEAGYPLVSGKSNDAQPTS